MAVFPSYDRQGASQLDDGRDYTPRCQQQVAYAFNAIGSLAPLTYVANLNERFAQII